MTSEWPWTLQGQKYLTYTEYFIPQAQILVRFALYDQPFLRYTWYKVVENQEHRKCTKWPQTEFEHLMVKSTLNALSTYPRGPNI